MSKIGHFTNTLNVPRELDYCPKRPVWTIREQLLTEGNGISLHFCIRVNLGARHCTDFWSHYHLAIKTYQHLFLLRILQGPGMARDSWFCLFSIFLWVVKEMEQGGVAFWRQPKSMVSINRSDHQSHRLEGVKTSSIICPEDSILKFATVNTPAIPYTIQVGLATSIVPPTTFMEVSAVTWWRETS